MAKETKEIDIPHVLFYCKDCQWVVQGQKRSGKYEYTCPICKGKKVAFGSGRAIVDFFHIKESILAKMLANPMKKE